MEDLAKPATARLEHIVAGAQPAAWALAILAHQPSALDAFKAAVKDFQTPALVVAFACFYPLGLFLDEVADFLLQRLSRRIRNRVFQELVLDPDKVTAFAILASHESSFLRAYMDTVRARIRLSRVTALNAALALCACAAVRWRFGIDAHEAAWLAAILLVMALWSWSRFEETFSRRLGQFELHRRGALPADLPPSPPLPPAPPTSDPGT